MPGLRRASDRMTTRVGRDAARALLGGFESCQPGGARPIRAGVAMLRGHPIEGVDRVGGCPRGGAGGGRPGRRVPAGQRWRGSTGSAFARGAAREGVERGRSVPQGRRASGSKRVWAARGASRSWVRSRKPCPSSISDPGQRLLELPPKHRRSGSGRSAGARRAFVDPSKHGRGRSTCVFRPVEPPARVPAVHLSTR